MAFRLTEVENQQMRSLPKKQFRNQLERTILEILYIAIAISHSNDRSEFGTKQKNKSI